MNTFLKSMKKSNLLTVSICILIVIEVIMISIILLKLHTSLKYKDHITLGDKYFNEMDYENAELHYIAAIKINKKEVVPYINLSQVYIDTEHYEEAYNILQLAKENIKKKHLSIIEKQENHLNQIHGITNSNSENDQIISKPVFEIDIDDKTVNLTPNDTAGNMSDVSITLDSDSLFINKVTIQHKGCQEPFVYIPTSDSMVGDFFGVDMGDGIYTYVLSLHLQSGSVGGSEIVILRPENGSLNMVKKFAYNDRSDNIYAEGTFSNGNTVKGTIYPTQTTFECVTSDAVDARTGNDIWENGTGSITYELNENGFYDLIFSTYERCAANADRIGSSKTRYILENDQLCISEQWYEIN